MPVLPNLCGRARESVSAFFPDAEGTGLTGTRNERGARFTGNRHRNIVIQLLATIKAPRRVQPLFSGGLNPRLLMAFIGPRPAQAPPQVGCYSKTMKAI